MFGRVVTLETRGEMTGFVRREGLVKRSVVVGVEIVFDQNNCFGLREH